jgi:hypothetical protein
LWGNASEQQQKQHDFDFFATMAAPAPVQNTQPDPFAFSAPVPAASSDPFGFPSAAAPQQQANLFAAPPQQGASFGSGKSSYMVSSNFNG